MSDTSCLPELYACRLIWHQISPLTQNSNLNFTWFFINCRPRFSHNDMQCNLFVGNCECL